MKGLDPIIQEAKVIPRVYDPEQNARLVRRFRKGSSYGGCTTIDVIGCNMLCSYCYVDNSFLTGRGELLDREKKAGTVRAYTPEALVEEYRRIQRKHGWPARVQVTAAEPFLASAPEWILGVIDAFGPVIEKAHSRLWVDTNGVAIAIKSPIADGLKQYRSFLRLFVSSKNAPEFYTAMTRVDAKWADTAFQAVQILWEKEVPAFLQAPVVGLFFQSTFEWYLGRLLKIHPAAPLLLDLDPLSYLPLWRIRTRLKSTGLWEKREVGVKKVEKAWQEVLEKHYGKKMKRLIAVDEFPEDDQLVEWLIFENRPPEKCHLFI